MRSKTLFFLMAMVSGASCLDLKIELDSDSLSIPQWISGTLKIKNGGTRPVVVSMEESQPEFFLSQDTSVKLARVTDFGPKSPVSLEPGVSAMWCFMAEIPEAYNKSKRSGVHKVSLRVRQFGSEGKSTPFLLRFNNSLPDTEAALASMKGLTAQLSKEEIATLDSATRRIAFSGKVQGNVDPRVLFWKYRLQHAAYMKDLKQMPICENCFSRPPSLYWSNLLLEWCGMFHWETPRCPENEARLQAMLVTRMGKLVDVPPKSSVNPEVHTEFGTFVVRPWQMKMLGGGGPRK